jgi:hypothetical protein
MLLLPLPFHATQPPHAPDAKPAPAEFREVGLPQGPEVPGLKLTPDQTVKVSRRFVVIQASTDKPEQKVKWVVLGSAPGQPPAAVVSPSGKSVLVFLPNHADLIAVMAYSATADGPTEPAVSKVTVEGPADGPEAQRAAPTGAAPAPAGRRAPAAGPLHLTLVVDFAKQTPEVAALRASTKFRQALAQGGCEYHEYAASQCPEDMKALLKEEGLGPPAAVVQDAEGNVKEIAPVTTAEALLALLDRARRGQ